MAKDTPNIVEVDLEKLETLVNKKVEYYKSVIEREKEVRDDTSVEKCERYIDGTIFTMDAVHKSVVKQK